MNKSKDTQGFFSSVVRGETHRPLKQWKPILDMDFADIVAWGIYKKHLGPFDEHIATSIPGFRDIQIKKIAALMRMKRMIGSMYDIGGSEGSFAKAVVEATHGNITAKVIDPNKDMQEAFYRTPVDGCKFRRRAFYEGFDDVKRYNPLKKADVVHESMTFQFIEKRRDHFIKEIKDHYLTPHGLFITEGKFTKDNMDEYLLNERLKDENFKSQYYSPEALKRKSDEVLVGMTENQANEREYLQLLKSNFKHVQCYWEAGNFKGYACSNERSVLKTFIQLTGEHEIIH